MDTAETSDFAGLSDLNLTQGKRLPRLLDPRHVPVERPPVIALGDRRSQSLDFLNQQACRRRLLEIRVAQAFGPFRGVPRQRRLHRIEARA